MVGFFFINLFETLQNLTFYLSPASLISGSLPLLSTLRWIPYPQEPLPHPDSACPAGKTDVIRRKRWPSRPNTTPRSCQLCFQPLRLSPVCSDGLRSPQRISNSLPIIQNITSRSDVTPLSPQTYTVHCSLGPRHLPHELFPPLTLMLSNRILHRFPHVRLRALLPTTVALPQSLSFSTPSTNNLFANGTNAYHVEEMYWYWKQDPKPVHPSWDIYFSGLEKGPPSSVAFQRPPSVMPVPSDGVPALHASSGAELDHHLKVCLAPLSCDTH